MSKIKGLFQKAWTVVTNPGQDERVQVVLQAIQTGFREQKQAFNLEKILQPIECTFKDVEVAARQYYESFVGRYWTNGIPDEKQIKLIAWVAEKLELKAAEVSSINLRVAETAFGARLANALEDGVISDENWRNSIASHDLQKFHCRFSLGRGGVISRSDCFVLYSLKQRKQAICRNRFGTTYCNLHRSLVSVALN